MVEGFKITRDINLNLGTILELFRRDSRLTLDLETAKSMEDYRRKLLSRAEETPLYGVSTGFGALRDVIVAREDMLRLQYNLVRSHSIGVGDASPEDIVRLTALFKAVELARGYSGVRPEVVEKLLEVFNKKIHVYIPLQGSVGASGDLAPLSHLALFLVGEGEYLKGGVRRKGFPPEFEPLRLDVKEGISLVNGTAYSLALLTYSTLRAYRILDRAIIGLSLSFSAMKGNLNSLKELIHDLRKHKGQKIIASKLRSMLEDSDTIIDSEIGREQDPYCLRCIPQILGSTLDVLEFVKSIVEGEMNSVTDNPLVDGEGRVYNGCNFHAMYLAQASDILKSTIIMVGELSEKHLCKLLSGGHRAGLPRFLTEKPGLNSGLMLLQYTAASLLAEAKSLASPTSIHNTPTSGGQEDVNSMSVPSLILLGEELERLEWVVSSLILASTIALKILLGDGSLKGRIGEFYEKYSEIVDTSIVERDKPYYDSLERLKEMEFPRELKNYKYHVVEDLIA